jgi:hypothetical protein
LMSGREDGPHCDSGSINCALARVGINALHQN